MSSFCEAKFYRAIVETLNDRVGRYMLFMMVFNAGMWNASTGELILPARLQLHATYPAKQHSCPRHLQCMPICLPFHMLFSCPTNSILDAPSWRPFISPWAPSLDGHSLSWFPCRLCWKSSSYMGQTEFPPPFVAFGSIAE